MIFLIPYQILRVKFYILNSVIYTLLEIQVFGGNRGISILMKGVSEYKVVYINGNPYDTEY